VESTIQNKDMFNMSNDEAYNAKLTTDSALGRNFGGTIIQVEQRPITGRVGQSGKLNCVRSLFAFY